MSLDSRLNEVYNNYQHVTIDYVSVQLLADRVKYAAYRLTEKLVTLNDRQIHREFGPITLLLVFINYNIKLYYCYNNYYYQH